jgi:hypothetical protein
MEKKKILVSKNVFNAINKNAKPSGLTTDELAEATLKRVFNVK